MTFSINLRRFFASLVVLLGVYLLVTDYLAAHRPVKPSGTAAAAPVSITGQASLDYQLTRIDSLRLGQRVWSANPTDEFDDSLGSDVNPATWKRLALRCEKRDGSTAEVELLRPDDWVELHQAEAGRTVYISVPECGIDGNAEVLSVQACPEIQTGTGRVIIGKFRHLVESTIEIQLEGTDDAIECTGNHPIWSEDRQSFVRADSLQPGERLRLRNEGETKHTRVVQTLRRPGPTYVYNIEVQADHTYHVGLCGALVHNGGPSLPVVDCAFVPRIGSTRSFADNLDDNVVLHYTDDVGYRGILSTGQIRPDAKGRVFVTQELLNETEVMDQLFIGASKTHGNRGRNVIAVRLSPGAVTAGPKGTELIHQGTLRLDKHEIIYAGPNPF
jgi:hypothetical protein